MKRAYSPPQSVLPTLYWLFIVLLFSTNVELHSQTLQNTNGWYPNGLVETTTEDDTHIYLGGDFTHMVKHGTNGMITNGAVLQTSNNGSVVQGYPMIDAGSVNFGGIRSIIPDGSGGWFIAGKFETINGISRKNLAHIKADKTLDVSWYPNAIMPNYGYEINTLLLNGNDLYLGGVFAQFGGLDIKNLVKINATTGQIDANWKPNPNNSVTSLAIANNNLFVGGAFNNIGGHSIYCLAKIFAGTGVVDSTWKPHVAYSTAIDFVYTMAILGDNIFVGGNFMSFGNTGARRVAKISISTGIVDNSWKPQPAGTIGALVATTNYLYLGGSFTYLNGSSTYFKNVARVNPQTGLPDHYWYPRFSGPVSSLLLQGNDLYVGGSFREVGVGYADIKINNIIKLKTNELAADNSWKPVISDRGEVSAMALYGNELFIGGNFISVGGRAHKNLARIRKSDMELDTLWKPQPDAWVSALLRDKEHLYVGGRFAEISGKYIGGLARVSTSNVGVVDENWKPQTDGWINSFAIRDTNLYVAGRFTEIGGKPRNMLAKITTKNTGTADGAWICNVGGGSPWIHKILLIDNDLYVGGTFEQIGSFAKKNLAKVDANTGAVNQAWTPNPNNTVSSMASFGTDLYVAGHFTYLSNSTRKSVARFSNNGVLHNWNPTEVWGAEDLAFSGTDLYILGSFVGNKQGIARFLSTNIFDNNWHLSIINKAKYYYNAGGFVNLYEGGVGTHLNILSKAITGGYFARAHQQSVSNLVVFEASIVPEIEVLGNNISIANRDTTPYQEDGTDLGYAIPNTGTVRNYTIRNIGAGTLQITSINCTNTTDFNISGLTLPAQVQSGGSVTFSITINAPSTGLKTGKIIINNNDADEGFFEYGIRAQVNATYPPKIVLKGNNQNISIGSLVINSFDNTDFGETTIGNPKTHTFVIKNTGLGMLNVTNIASSMPQDFALGGITLPINIPSGDSTTFTITQMLVLPDFRESIISIQNNDIDGGNYTFKVGGKTLAPKMFINVPNGSISKYGITILGHPISEAYGIENTNRDSFNQEIVPLIVSSVVIDNPIDFELLLSQNNRVVEVRFKALSIGIKKTKVTIHSNDLINSTYTFTIQAETNIWKPNGAIYAMAEDDTHIYAGGLNSRWYKKGVAGVSGSTEFIPLSGNGDPLTTTIPEVDTQISTVVSDGAGGWFIGGDFTKVGNIHRPYIAHIKSDYTLDMGWNPPAMAPVGHLVLHNNYLYANATFGTGTNPNDIALNVARLNASTGLLDTSWQPDPNNTIQDIQINSSHVYLMGAFSIIGGVTINHLARVSFSGVTDSVWKPNFTGYFTPYSMMALGPNGIFLKKSNALRKFSLAGDGYFLGWEFNLGTLDSSPSSTLQIHKILAVGDYVFVGGRVFAYVFPNTIRGLVRLPANGSSPTVSPNWTFHVSGTVNCLEVVGNELYVGVGGDNQTAYKLDINGNGTISNTWKPQAYKEVNRVYAMASNGNVLCLIKDNRISGGLKLGSLVRFRKSDMELDLNWTPQVQGSIGSLALSQNNVFIGGELKSINNITTPSIGVAKISKAGTGVFDTNWQPLPTRVNYFNPNVDENTSVNKLLLVNNELYMSGYFDKVKGISRNHIAKVSTEGTGEVDLAWNPNVTFSANSIESINMHIQGDSLFVFGTFTAINGQMYNGSAKISRLGTGMADLLWKPNVNNSNSQVIHGNDLYMMRSWGYGSDQIDSLHRFSTKGTGMSASPLKIQTSSYQNYSQLTAVHNNQIYLNRLRDLYSSYSASMTHLYNYSSATGVLNTNWKVYFLHEPYYPVYSSLISNDKMILGGVGIFGWTSIPESNINIKGNNQSILNGATTPVENNHTDFGIVNVGIAKERTYTIHNEGLVILSVNSISISSPDFLISDIVLPTHLQSGANVTFKVTCLATTKGVKIATIQINNTDPNKGSYTFMVKANVQDGEIDILGNNINIPNGSTSINVDNNTNFGNSALGVPNTKNFTIKNMGAGILKINNIGSSNTNFTIGNLNFPILIQAGNSHNFQITHNSNIIGMASSVISVASTDEDEANYTFEVQTHVITAEINVFGNGISIESGFSNPNINNSTNFGACTVGEGISKTFTIKNEGLGALQITNIQLSNSTAFSWNAVALPILIEAGQSWNFEVVFYGNAITTHNSQVIISNNDVDEASYTFAISAQTLAPFINVLSNNVAINAGSTQISTLDNTDFGTNAFASTNVKNFTIQNGGLGKLKIYSISQTNTENFTIQDIAMPLIIEANESFTFTIELKTNSVGEKKSTIYINSNDIQIDVFSFDIGAIVIKSPQIITFNALPAKTFGDAPFALNASASSNLEISYSSSNTNVATISGNTVTIVGAGTTTITASQNGNENYLPATSVTQDLVVNKANQTITFNAIADKVYGNLPFQLNATSNSNLAVSYSISTLPATGVATLSGNTVTIIGLGSVSITASQAGNTNYNPATEVVRTFQVLYPTSTQPSVAVGEVVAFPNPSKSGVFEVRGLQSIDKQQVSYVVIDASGKEIMHGIWVGKDVETLNLSAFANGVYILDLRGSKKQITKKIVKQ